MRASYVVRDIPLVPAILMLIVMGLGFVAVMFITLGEEILPPQVGSAFGTIPTLWLIAGGVFLSILLFTLKVMPRWLIGLTWALLAIYLLYAVGQIPGFVPIFEVIPSSLHLYLGLALFALFILFQVKWVLDEVSFRRRWHAMLSIRRSLSELREAESAASRPVAEEETVTMAVDSHPEYPKIVRAGVKVAYGQLNEQYDRIADEVRRDARISAEAKAEINEKVSAEQTETQNHQAKIVRWAKLAAIGAILGPSLPIIYSEIRAFIP